MLTSCIWQNGWMIIFQNRGPVKARWAHSIKRKEGNTQQFSMSAGYSSKESASDPFLKNSCWICSPFNSSLGIEVLVHEAFLLHRSGFLYTQRCFLITFSKLLHHVWDCLGSKFKTWEEGEQWSENSCCGNLFWVSHTVDYFAWQDLPGSEWELLMELSFMVFVCLMWWWKVLGVRFKEKKKNLAGGEAHKYAIWSDVFTWYWVKDLQIYVFIHLMFL